MALTHTFLNSMRMHMPLVKHQGQEQAIEFHLTSCIQSYLKFNVGELFSCQREEGNSEDPYAVVVISDGNVYVVGHILRLMSAACSLPPSSRTFKEPS